MVTATATVTLRPSWMTAAACARYRMYRSRPRDLRLSTTCGHATLCSTQWGLFFLLLFLWTSKEKVVQQHKVNEQIQSKRRIATVNATDEPQRQRNRRAATSTRTITKPSKSRDIICRDKRLKFFSQTVLLACFDYAILTAGYRRLRKQFAENQSDGWSKWK